MLKNFSKTKVDTKSNYKMQQNDYSTEFILIDCINKCNDESLEHPQNALVVSDINLPGKKNANSLCGSVDGVLSDAECETIIKRAEGMGFMSAMMNGGEGEIFRPEVQKSGRCIIDDVDFANVIFNRIKNCLPSVIINGWGLECDLVGLNERMHVLRYDNGEYFAPHQDGSYSKNSNTRSFLTVVVYLNSGGGLDFEGGTSNFVSPYETENSVTKFVPKRGGVLAFDHSLLHEGAAVVRGTKYCIRTDVMYTQRN
uniref:Fe2OG dioxygenase domain-containing protein n=1 Tax=Proboscia inermis TaxID=420281 RepID=A0A7S0C5A9_9STRA|mmetsp:Transcript_26567/g.26950  ORF Transcript_26567/g.26950 Transcript_26567/m.26950 type:complete len:255 (+) Transcript_26567:113-877(+)